MTHNSPEGLSAMDSATFTMLRQIAEAAARSGVVKGSHGAAASAEQCLMKLICGRDLGLNTLAALTGIQFIDGGMEIGGNLLACLVQRHPDYDYTVVKRDDSACTLRFAHHGEPVGEITYGVEQATRAGLIASDYYRRHPAAMFFNRAMSAGVKLYCPSVTNGATVYVDGELRRDAEPPAQTPRANGASDGETPVRSVVIADGAEISQIRAVAATARLGDGELYNVIARVAGGSGNTDLEHGAKRLEATLRRMPKHYVTPVLTALTGSAAPAAAPSSFVAARNGDSHARPTPDEHVADAPEEAARRPATVSVAFSTLTPREGEPRAGQHDEDESAPADEQHEGGSAQAAAPAGARERR